MNTINNLAKHFFPGDNTIPYRRDISSAYNARSARDSAQVTTINTKPRQEMAATVTHTHTSHLLSEKRGHKIFDSNFTLATLLYRLGRSRAEQANKQTELLTFLQEETCRSETYEKKRHR
jgi:hypothetical protein